MNYKPFCENLFQYKRYLTRVVHIGDVPLGGSNPIRVQSMTTTDTMDTAATVAQSIRMIEAGCEYVRITAPSINEARNLGEIKKELRKQGFQTPLIADIHFTPNAAELAARLVEKVRVNPGNYADKKKFEVLEYTDQSYNEELERIYERFSPLVKICKENGTAMRIGTNHGSLSDRIMSRYGDTPLGMVESAMEFLRICRDHSFHEIVLSMKASNPKVMVEAYRLLTATMIQEGMNYPLHLGVTEAGDGEDGRIKSAAGIGTLLEDGLGDTIRVSLTEDPEHEIPVARALADRYKNRHLSNPVKHQSDTVVALYSPFEYLKRESHAVLNVGGANVPRVLADLSAFDSLKPANLFSLGYKYSVSTDKWSIGDQACDYLYTGNAIPDFELPGTLGIVVNSNAWETDHQRERVYPLFCGTELFSVDKHHPQLNFLAVTINELDDNFLANLKRHRHVVLLLDTMHDHGMAEQRSAMLFLQSNGVSHPVILKRNYLACSPGDASLYASTDFGGLLLDGWGDGIWMKAPGQSLALINSTSFGVLQATRTRISKTEYISCPSCGRTLFDLQETTAKIRLRTGHLKGVKIGIMGCIVNGPGEMADADYGYVGSGVGKITLYKGKEVVKKAVPAESAVDELIELIRQHGDWVEMSPKE